MDVQEIYLDTSEDGNSYALTSNNVQVHTCEKFNVTRDSSLVKSTSLVEYRWEVNTYKGNLVAVHREGDFIAYILHGNQSRGGCAVRVYHKSTKERGLIKRLEGQATDIAWAFSTQPLYLGVVDEGGNLFVHLVTLGPRELNIVTFFHMRRSEPVPGIQYRLVWCPYVVDELNDFSANDGTDGRSAVSTPPPNSVQDFNGGEGADSASSSAASFLSPSSSGAASLRSFGLLAVAHGDTVNVLDLEPLIENHGRDVILGACQHGVATIHAKGEVMALAMSPDATALAVANSTGEVAFYIMESLYDVREAHQWIPHNGRPVTAIHFLDDITVMGKEAHFWRFALTASDDNRELKIFSCENWSCINTLRIGNPRDHLAPDSHSIVITMDWTAGFVLMSDIDRKAFYIVQISQDESSAKFVSFSEFPLVQPALSIAVVETAMKRFRPFSPGCLYESSEKDFVSDEENGKVTGVRAQLYAVNPRSLLELEIRFQPKIFHGGDNHFDSTVSLQHDIFQDKLSDLSAESAIFVSVPVDQVSKAFSVTTSPIATACSASSPAGSVTPVTERRESVEPERPSERQVSNSPNSQEVRSILSHSLAESSVVEHFILNSGNTNSSCLMVDVANTQRCDSHPEIQKSSLLNTKDYGSPKSPPKIGYSDGGPNTSIVIQPTTNADLLLPLIESFTKIQTKMQECVDCMQQQMQHQSEELRFLRNAVENFADTFGQVPDLLHNTELRLQANEDLLTINQSQVHSFDAELFKQDVTRTIEDVVRHELQCCVKQELRVTVNEALKDLVPRTQQMLERDIAKLTIELGANLRDSFDRTVKARPTLDALGESAGRVMSDHLSQSFRHTFLTTAAPAFEKAIDKIFGQMNDLFRQGTSEFAEQLQRQVAADYAEMDRLRTALAHATEQVKSAINEQRTVAKRLDQSVRDAIKDEAKRVFAEGQHHLSDALVKAVRSTSTPAASPSPQVDRSSLQKDLSSLLQRHKYAEAFQVALNALDLNLVLYVCGKISASELFSATPCPLPQPIILSLIQQLSNDLSCLTELKLSYLTEAVTAIDSRSSPMQLQNVKRVIGQLERHLDTFSQQPVAAPFARQVKILTMAAQSLIR